jgi:hypothetical protein
MEEPRALKAIATDINEEHRLAVGAARRSLEHARRAGDLLIEVKSRLPHGEWLPWLVANCEFSERSAQGYMRLAREWDTVSRWASDLPLRDALALLSESRVRTIPIERVPTAGLSRLHKELDNVPVDCVSAAGLSRPDKVLGYVSVADKFSESVRRYGQLRPIVVARQADGTLSFIDGFYLLQQLKGQGVTEVDVIEVDVADEAEARVLQLATLTEFDIDYCNLALATKDLLDAGHTPEALASIAPFSAVRFQHLASVANFDWSRFTRDPSAPPVEPPPPHRCPQCGHEWDGPSRAKRKKQRRRKNRPASPSERRSPVLGRATPPPGPNLVSQGLQ